jgi:stage II sporulation protein AA (anti-sigma F factor antagonist)
MNVKSKIVDDILYVMLSGELDEHTSNYTKNCLEEIFNSNKFNKVVLDFAELEFMDSTGIGVLLGRYKKLNKNNKRIFISNPSNTIEKIFKMSGIYEIMPKIS